MRARVVRTATPARTAPSRTRRCLSRKSRTAAYTTTVVAARTMPMPWDQTAKVKKQRRGHETDRAPSAPRRHGQAGNRPDNVGDDGGVRVVGAPGRDHDRRTEQRDDGDRGGRDAVQAPHEDVGGHDGDQREQVASREKAGHGTKHDVKEPCDEEEPDLGSFAAGAPSALARPRTGGTSRRGATM